MCPTTAATSLTPPPLRPTIHPLSRKVGAAADAADLHEVYQTLCHEARCYATQPFPWSPRGLFVLTLIRGGSADPGVRENRPKILIATFLGVRNGRELRNLRASRVQLAKLVKEGNAQAKAEAKAEGQSAFGKLYVRTSY